MSEIDLHNIHYLLNQQLPNTALKRLGDVALPQAVCLRAHAMMMLDQFGEAESVLEPGLATLDGDWLSYAKRLKSEILYARGYMDEGIKIAQEAVQEAVSVEVCASSEAWLALGYAYKQCWSLADHALKQALARMVLPDSDASLNILSVKARVLLMMDEWLAARELYKKASHLKTVRAQVIAQSGLAQVAWLFGEFKDARKLSSDALDLSSEIIQPILLLANIALAKEDEKLMKEAVVLMKERSPKAESLSGWVSQLKIMENKALDRQQKITLGKQFSSRNRLKPFPTAIQRRDHCAPCAIELVLRYWKDSQGFSIDQIAQAVKYAKGGSPIYRMREFFHLSGYRTTRCFAGIEQLIALVDNGYPAIIQEAYAESSHVSVMIGYDREREIVELQDPISHILREVGFLEFERLRAHFDQAVLIAFPLGQKRESDLARIGLLDDTALISLDQCGLAIDEGRLEQAAELIERTIKQRPGLGMAWALRIRLVAELMQRLDTEQLQNHTNKNNKAIRNLRIEYYALIAEANKRFSNSAFVYKFQGDGLLRDGDVSRALEAYQKALDLEPQDAGIYSSLAACCFYLRELPKAVDMARRGLKINPAHPGAHVWMARALVFQEDSSAVHFAQCAIDLAGEWWLSHLALGECLMMKVESDSFSGRIPGSYEYEMAASMTNNQVDLEFLQARIQTRQGQPEIAILTLNNLLNKQVNLYPIYEYEGRRLLAVLLMAIGNLAESLEQVECLHKKFPKDGWACLFKAVLTAQLLNTSRNTPESSHSDIVMLFEKAVDLNLGSLLAVIEYLNYLENTVDAKQVALTINRISQKYHNEPGMRLLVGRWLARAGEKRSAAESMLNFLKTEEGVISHEDLDEALEVLVEGLGVEKTEEELCSLRIGIKNKLESNIRRHWGLVLARRVEEGRCNQNYVGCSKKTEQLLHEVLESGTEDSAIFLHLGLLSKDNSECEKFLKRAVLFSPQWTYARAVLANYLIDSRRAYEALQFTSGYEDEGEEIAIAHAVALLHLGWYEQAAIIFERLIKGRDLQNSEPLLGGYWNAVFNSGDIKQAYKIVQKAVIGFPQDIEWRIRQMRTLVRLNRDNEAEAIGENLSDEILGCWSGLEFYYDWAVMRLNWVEALNYSELMCSAGHGDGVARRLRAWAELGARDSINQWLVQASYPSHIWAACAWTMTMIENGMGKEEQTQLGLQLAERALEIETDNYHARLARAHLMINMGKEQAGLAEIEMLLMNYPDQYQPHSSMAIFYTSQGHLERAAEFAERAVEYGARDLFTFAVRGLVGSLRGNNQAALVDLQLAWRRADLNQRRRGYVFWWLLSILNSEDETVIADWGQKALLAAHTMTNRRIIDMILENQNIPKDAR